MNTEELIKYIYETELPQVVFDGDQQKGERALVLISKYGKEAQKELSERFGSQVTFSNIFPSTALEVTQKINEYLRHKSTSTTSEGQKYLRIYKDRIDQNINGFEFSYSYIGKGGKDSSTYLSVLDVSFFDGEKSIKRNREKNEAKKSALLLARLAVQVFEGSLDELDDVQLRSLKTDGTGFAIGVWRDKEALLKQWGNSANSGKQPRVEYVADMYLKNGFPSNSDGKYYFYNCGLYDAICLAQSLLKELGADNQYFEVIVSQKDDGNIQEEDDYLDSLSCGISTNAVSGSLQNKYSAAVLESKNVILRGAPGTGKSFLAKEIAADIVSNGETQQFIRLSDEQKRQIEFVQFHPSYDYTDFVEGLRPKISDDGSIGFELQDGVFKKAVAKARKSRNTGVDNFDECWDKLVGLLEENGFLKVPYAQGRKAFPIELNEYGTGLATRTYQGEYGEGEWVSGKGRFYNKTQLYNIYRGLPGVPAGGHDNYRKAIVQYMKESLGLKDYLYSTEGSTVPFVFIIDEINRGEISKIFGELFFAVDPGYRGRAGEVSTQYMNLHEDPDDRFFVPENVYIIGTMNDIDRSVDSFDFAMRRRFRFIEIKASEQLDMLDGLTEKDEAISRMNSLNEAISAIEELNENYHIGASYFLKLETLTFSQLWTDYLAPLLQDYVRGMYDEKGILEKLKSAYEKAGVINDDSDKS